MFVHKEEVGLLSFPVIYFSAKLYLLAKSSLRHKNIKKIVKGFVCLLYILEGAARYAGLLLALAEGFGLRPRLFLPFAQKNTAFLLF